MTTASPKDKLRVIEVSAENLPIHCPPPDAPLWARHPRVFLDVVSTGEAACPYCGTRFVFKGEKPKGHS